MRFLYKSTFWARPLGRAKKVLNPVDSIKYTSTKNRNLLNDDVTKSRRRRKLGKKCAFICLSIFGGVYHLGGPSYTKKMYISWIAFRIHVRLYKNVCMGRGKKYMFVCVCVCVKWWSDLSTPLCESRDVFATCFFHFFCWSDSFFVPKCVPKWKLCVCRMWWRITISTFLRWILKEREICANLREIFCCGQRAWTSLAGGTVRGNVAGLWVLRACEFPSFFESFFLFVFFPSFFPLFSLFPSIFLFLYLNPVLFSKKCAPLWDPWGT